MVDTHTALQSLNGGLLGSFCRLQKECWTSTSDEQQQQQKNPFIGCQLDGDVFAVLLGWVVSGEKKMSKTELNQELHQIQRFIHACTGSMEFKQQKQGQQKENWFHFDTWIDMHFFVMTVVIFCVLGAYSLSGEIHILQHTWLKAAGTDKHKYVGLSYTVAVHVHISHHCCARCCRVFIVKEKITGALGLLSRPLTEAEQAITSYCTI